MHLLKASKETSVIHLASLLQMDDYDWNVPKEEGDYWVTSQAPNDCANGGLAASCLPKITIANTQPCVAPAAHQLHRP
jgi:hypothetical protein